MIHAKDWFKDLVIYQIYPRSFQDSNGDGIGDLEGIRRRLDYLSDLGVNAVWLSPVYASPNVDNGYDISDYRAIMPEFGTMEDWDRLASECHRRGIAVIMDLVLNHSSDQHAWFRASSQSRTGPYSDYYIWRDPNPDGTPPNQWKAVFGGSAWEYVPARGQYYLHLFAKQQPDLNWDNPSVREEIYDIIRWWVDKGVDGFRVDAISYLDKGLSKTEPSDRRIGTAACVNLPGTHRYIHEMIQATCAPEHLMTVGEVNCNVLSDYSDYTAAARGEFSMAIPFVTPEEEIRTWSPANMRRTINETYEELRTKDGWWARFLSNHDKPRQVSLYGDDTQYWAESAKMLAALLHTLPGTPFIYQGEEIGMTNVRYAAISDYQDIESQNQYRELLEQGAAPEEALRHVQMVSRDNARTPMQWDASENAGFTTGVPWLALNENYPTRNVAAQKDSSSILSFYKSLIRLRKENPILIHGDYQPLFEDQEPLIAYTRTYQGITWAALHNFGRERRALNLSQAQLRGTVLLSNYGRSGAVSETIFLEPYETLLISAP